MASKYRSMVECLPNMHKTLVQSTAFFLKAIHNETRIQLNTKNICFYIQHRKFL